MSRTAARIKHDEVVRMVKAVKACGLPVSRVVFDGSSVAVIIGEAEAKDVDRAANDQPANEVDHL